MYLIFFFTVLLLAFSPGPNVVLMIDNGLKYHIKYAIFAVFGTVTALFIYAIFSIFCIQGIFNISKNFYNILKVLGTLYLVYLGLKNIFYKHGFKIKEENVYIPPKRKKLFAEAFFCCITNPKILFVYIALMPNYIVSEKNVLIQNLVLAMIQISTVSLAMITYIIIARKASHLFKNKIKYVSYISGMVMIFLAASIFLNN
ncbi:LysE family translocator [Fluviispira vulneris]|uniref:LysE family translocator n=1 Tax=Fluviispira vulneris TaxID=2763012 RepID=UPI001647A77E|nr:LysE family translocator [Fluviispira vulneris]